LTLLSVGSEPKVGALFAQAELNRSCCDEHNPILKLTCQRGVSGRFGYFLNFTL